MHCISQFPAVLQLLDAHCSCFKFRPGSRLEFLHHLASEANPARRIRGFSTELLSLLGSPATKRLQLLWMAWVGTYVFLVKVPREKRRDTWIDTMVASFWIILTYFEPCPNIRNMLCSIWESLFRQMQSQSIVFMRSRCSAVTHLEDLYLIQRWMDVWSLLEP